MKKKATNTNRNKNTKILDEGKNAAIIKHNKIYGRSLNEDDTNNKNQGNHRTKVKEINDIPKHDMRFSIHKIFKYIASLVRLKK